MNRQIINALTAASFAIAAVVGAWSVRSMFVADRCLMRLNAHSVIVTTVSSKACSLRYVPDAGWLKTPSGWSRLHPFEIYESVASAYFFDGPKVLSFAHFGFGLGFSHGLTVVIPLPAIVAILLALPLLWLVRSIKSRSAKTSAGRN